MNIIHQKTTFEHISVMLDETIFHLLTDPCGTYVDCTLGGAGHAAGLLERLAQKGRFIGIDQDGTAIAHAMTKLEQDPRVTLVQSNFANISTILNKMEIDSVQGFLFDLGVSSPQIDEADRGFSYNHDAVLDMRMNQNEGVSAAEVLNSASVKELTRIFIEYGEERWAARIAQFIEERRRQKPLTRTGELVDVIKAAIPAAARRKGPHPAKRVFQALRIQVNRELEVLETALDQAMSCLAVQGRLAVITFQSLEEKIVTEKIRQWLGRCTCPPGLPVCCCGRVQQIDLVTRKAVLPAAAEIERNPRARSAKLRVIAKKG